MKKLMFALLVAVALVGCDETVSSPQTVSSTQCSKPPKRKHHVETVWDQESICMKRIEGHLYLVGYVDYMCSAAGVRCIVHAESCPCKSIEKKGD